MTFIVGACAHGSPGVSTALQLAASLWPNPDAVPVIVEADVSGGVLAARYELSLSPGFVTLAESLRKFEAPPILSHAQRLPSGVACVTLSPSATAASAQLRSASPYLGPYLAQSGHPVFLDAGLVVPGGKAVAALTAADMVLWFVRPTREELLVLRHRLAECPQPETVGIVLVGETPYNAAQVTEGLGVEVVHVLPIDRRGATATILGGDDRFLRRSPLARSCSRLVTTLHQRLRPSPPKPPADIAESDLAEPDLAGPDLVGPDLAGPDLAGPDIAGPDIAGPDFAELDVWEPAETSRIDKAAESKPSEIDEFGDPDLVVWVNEGQT